MVYISELEDTIPIVSWPYYGRSLLIADFKAELVEFAVKIGFRPGHIQTEPILHYRCWPRRHDAAIAAGAVLDWERYNACATAWAYVNSMGRGRAGELTGYYAKYKHRRGLL